MKYIELGDNIMKTAWVIKCGKTYWDGLQWNTLTNSLLFSTKRAAEEEIRIQLLDDDDMINAEVVKVGIEEL